MANMKNLLAFYLLIGLVAGCVTNSAEAPRVAAGSDWPQANLDADYQMCRDGCVSEGGPTVNCKKLCACTIDKIHRRIPFSKIGALIIAANTAKANGTPLTGNLAVIADFLEEAPKQCAREL